MFVSAIRKTGFAALVVSLFGFQIPETAVAAAPEIRIGFVDLQKALASSVAGKEAQKKYETEVKKAQAQLDAKKAELEKLQQAYSKQRESLNSKARAEKEEELMSKEKDLKRSFQDSQDSLRRKNAEIINDLVRQMRKVVEELGNTESYTFILEKGAPVLFGDKKVDLTEQVVKKFDEVSAK